MDQQLISCNTNAKQSALIVWIPRAIAAGAEIRDLAMVGKVDTNRDGRSTGVRYQREDPAHPELTFRPTTRWGRSPPLWSRHLYGLG